MKIYRSLSFVLVAACLALSAPLALACPCLPGCDWIAEYRSCLCDNAALSSSLADRDLQLQTETGVTLDSTFAVTIFDPAPTLQCVYDASTGIPEPFLKGLAQAGVSVVERDSAAEGAVEGAQPVAGAESVLPDVGAAESFVIPERD